MTPVEARYYEFLDLVGQVLGDSWICLLNSLGPDSHHESDPSLVYCGLMNAPAGKGNHHATVGGLIEHYREMSQLYKALPANITHGDPLINDKNVLAGIILHDLSKCWYTFTMKQGEDGQPPVFDYGNHPSSRLMNDNQKSVYLAMRGGVTLDMIMMNILFTSEGGWAKGPPRWVTTVSKLVYLLDELSGNVLNRGVTGTFLNVRETIHPDALIEFNLDRWVP